MRYLVLFSVVIAGTTTGQTILETVAASVIKDPTQGYKEGDRFFYFPGDGDGLIHLVDTKEFVDYEFIKRYEYTENPNNNGYWLFTRANPTTAQVIEMYNVDSLENSNFNSSNPVTVLAHGWKGHGLNSINRQLTEAFLQHGDFNVFVLDWSQLANRNYLTAKNGVPAVGRGLGQFLDWLVYWDASFNTMHLVGFSLGGHLVGCAGRETGAQVSRITALDPAGPLWGSDRERIVQTDARYVEVIHTNIFNLGFTDSCGDADFYPNGGSGMPGCSTNSCSHGRAVDFMVASIRYDHFLANKCGTLTDATNDRCTGGLYPMGNSDLDKSGSGIFRVNTASIYPF